MPQRKRYLFVCNNQRPLGNAKGSCATRGAEALHKALKAELAARGLAQAELRACTSSCQDVCWSGPIVQVAPDNLFYGRVTLDDVAELVDAVTQGKVLERLRLGPEEFEMATAAPGLPEEVPPEKVEPG